MISRTEMASIARTVFYYRIGMTMAGYSCVYKKSFPNLWNFFLILYGNPVNFQ